MKFEYEIMGARKRRRIALREQLLLGSLVGLVSLLLPEVDTAEASGQRPSQLEGESLLDSNRNILSTA